jgi:NADPH:quinone reductase-like Zn-dependent oxidoreductase
MAEAASLPLVALTAWQALVERADVQPGQRVLIHAGSGGVGTVAIQLAKHLGAFVATTSSAANAAWLRELGADLVVDYRTEDFTEVLHDYDVVLDSLGADSILRSLQVLRPGGMAISLGGPPDPDLARQLGKPMLRPVLAILSRKVRAAARKRGVTYSFLLMRADGGQLQRITELVETGALKPVVDRTFAFEDALDALDYVGTGRAKGKVVLTME